MPIEFQQRQAKFSIQTETWDICKVLEHSQQWEFFQLTGIVFYIRMKLFPRWLISYIEILSTDKRIKTSVNFHSAFNRVIWINWARFLFGRQLNFNFLSSELIFLQFHCVRNSPFTLIIFYISLLLHIDIFKLLDNSLFMSRPLRTQHDNLCTQRAINTQWKRRKKRLWSR